MQQCDAVASDQVFAHLEPFYEWSGVEYLRAMEGVMATIGDRVHNAPALEKAEIAIAIGFGMAVAKSASHMVLADDTLPPSWLLLRKAAPTTTT